MPSQEATLLADFLLAPASLRDFLTLKQFVDIFPKSYRSNPAVKDLYQELQLLRLRDLETVRNNIADEVKRSTQLKRRSARERQEDDHTAVTGLNMVALQVEEELSGRDPQRKPHTLQSIHPSIEDACRHIEIQLAEIEEEIQDALSEVQEAVGELSDLRYGSLSKSVGGGDITGDVLIALKQLDASCSKYMN